METFAAAAVSVTIAMAVIIRRTKQYLHLTFAAVCIAVFLEKFGIFSYRAFQAEYWKVIHYLGFLLLPPGVLLFSRYLLKYGIRGVTRAAILSGLASLVIALSFFTPVVNWPYLPVFLMIYCGVALVYCFGALVRYIAQESSGTEKKRMTYIAIACVVALGLSVSDVLVYFGYQVPPLSDIALAALLYFVFIVIIHTDLPELYEIMMRALFIFLVMCFITVVFYGVIALFGMSVAFPLTSVFMASFVIVILIDPVKMIVKKALSYAFFDKKDFSTSLYSLENNAERRDFTILEEMTTGFAHEIRNPLGSIKGAAQYLKTETEATGDSKLLDIIIEETDRLNTAVSQFLNYAKPRVMNVARQDMNNIIRKVLSLIKTTNLPKNITVEENLASDLPLVRVDGEQMIQVVLNMALNGIEAMPDGGTLSFHTSRVKDEGRRKVEIAIHDTGRGITRDERKTIFKPFHTTKKKGTGLGLPICQRIVRDHGGSIHVESSPGKGTTFLIRL